VRKPAQKSNKTREQLLRELRSAYEQGASIRNLAATTGRSYGSVHSMLRESGTTMRGRGGPNHTSGSARA
jgi:transposase-like protein